LLGYSTGREMHFKFDSDYIHRARQRVAMVVGSMAGYYDPRMLKTAGTVSKLGYQVCLYCLNNKDAAAKIEGYPFEIVLLPNPRFELMRSGRWSAVVEDRDWDEFTHIFARHLLEQIKQKPPQFLHTHDAMGFAIGGKVYHHSDKSTFSWIHDIPEYTRGDISLPESVRSFLSIVEEKLIHSPGALTCVSSALNEILQDFYSLKTKPSLVLNAPRCSDFDRYHPRDVRTALGVPQNVPLLVYSGTVRPLRSLETLVEALPLLPQVHVAIVTNSAGEYVEGLKTLAQNLGVNNRIHLHPLVPFYNVTSFLRTATVGINPLRRYANVELGLYQKVFEYLHAGLPQVVSNNRAVEEFVSQYDCGLVFEAGDVNSLAEAVTRVLDRLNSEPSWRQSIQALSEQYCWERQEDVIADVYDALTPRKSGNNDSLEEGKNYRVLHLPTAGAGQPDALTNAMKKRRVSASSLMVSGGRFQHHADYTLENVPNDLDATKQILNELIEEHDVFHFHSRPLLFSYRYSYPTGMDLLLLRAAGKKVFFHFRGFEARLASVFERWSPYNYVRDNPDNIVRNFRENKQRLFIEFVSGVCNGVFVTDRELQTYVPGALIMPCVVDLKKWAFVGTEPSEVLRVVHAPTRRVVKGTKYVLSVVEQLRSEGIGIELRLVEGVPHNEAKKLYKWADVVIDQLRVGWYGVVAVEAMALGKAVVCYIRDDLKHYLPHPLPLAVANPENLYHVLKDLALNPEEVRSLGLRGRKYVEELHDAKKVTEILLRVYEAGGNPFDIDKAVKLLSFQRKPLISKEFIRKLWMRKAYVNKRNFVAFLRMLRRDGLRVAVRETYDLFFS